MGVRVGVGREELVQGKAFHWVLGSRSPMVSIKGENKPGKSRRRSDRIRTQAWEKPGEGLDSWEESLLPLTPKQTGRQNKGPVPFGSCAEQSAARSTAGAGLSEPGVPGSWRQGSGPGLPVLVGAGGACSPGRTPHPPRDIAKRTVVGEARGVVYQGQIDNITGFSCWTHRAGTSWGAAAVSGASVL